MTLEYLLNDSLEALTPTYNYNTTDYTYLVEVIAQLKQLLNLSKSFGESVGAILTAAMLTLQRGSDCSTSAVTVGVSLTSQIFTILGR